MQLKYQSLNVEEKNVAFCILWIRSQSLDQQRTAAVLHQKVAALVLVRVQLLQLVNSSLRCMANRRQVSVTKSPEEVNRRIGQTHFGRRPATGLCHVLIAR